MRPHLVLFAILLVAPVTAAPPGITPALEGKGSSSTTISVLGGAASVTVEAQGSGGANTNAGTADGAGSIGVPGLGISLGGDTVGSPAANNASKGKSDDSSAGKSTKTALARESAGPDCHDLARLTGLRSVSNSAVRAASHALVAVLCDSPSSGLDDSLGLIIEKNSDLVLVLDSYGREPTDVVGVGQIASGEIVLLVTN